jgi:WS/DGAT/MGAT family acyltransferase
MDAKMKHLSMLDGAFLHLESAEMPMHVGSLHVFDPPPGADGHWVEVVKEHMLKRMHLAPVFTRKLAPMPFDLANPVWIEDDDVDIDYHVRHTVLPRPGSMAQLEALAARLHSSLLDRSRPLWEFYVIEGLADGRMGFYAKVHHAAIDGQAGVALANAIYDITPEPRVVKPPRRRRRSECYQLGVAELLAAAITHQARQAVALAGLVRPVLRTVGGLARDLVTRRRTPGAAASLLSRLRLAPPTPFNTTITNQRVFAGVSLPLDEVRAIGRVHGASINDMVLWLTATALRRHLKEAGELPASSLVAFVPVSMRADGDTSSNNQVTATLADLATEVADPLERLRAILKTTAAMKKEMGALKALTPTDFPSLGSPWLLSGLMSLYGRSRLADRIRVVNVAVSNVPGPKFPLYLAGARMLNYFPLSIVTHGVALNVTVQSYENQLCFGLIACRRAVSDLPEFAGDLRRAMDELRKLPAEAAAHAQAAQLPARPQPTAAVPARPPKVRTARRAGAVRSARSSTRAAPKETTARR